MKKRKIRINLELEATIEEDKDNFIIKFNPITEKTKEVKIKVIYLNRG